MTEEPLSLDLLSEQEEGIVLYISAGKALITKLAAMGVAHGTRVKIARKAGSGPIILQSGETRFALGAGEAAKIIVQRLQPHPECLPEEPPAGRIIYVALTGQPNVGKSTIFNILTGLSQHVGNWPGKTVEKKEGHHLSNGTEMRITDLPGTYSLTSFSEEERITRDFIATANPDVIVLLVNAAALERSLYLLAEMLLLGPPVIVALNMLDVAEAQGIHVDAKALEKSLGIPVVPMVATKNRGVRELVARIIALDKGEEDYYPNLPDISKDHSGVFEDLMTLIKPHLQLPGTARWLATKLMEGDPEISSIIEGLVPVDVWREVRDILIKHEDALHAVVGGRYDWIEAITRASVSRFKMGEVVMTDRIDHILTRPMLGIPVLFGVFGLVFAATYKIGFPLQKGLEWAVSVLAEGLTTVMGSMPAWFRGLLIDGVIGGAGSVLTFIPILLIFFAFMAVLEDVGYMARAAFVMDRFMHLIGLHGKSFIPMCLGFGCNVPSILGARIVESKKEKLLTIFLSPFIPCTARLAVLAFITAAIFGNLAMYVSWGLAYGQHPASRHHRRHRRQGFPERGTHALHHGTAALPEAQLPNDRPRRLGKNDRLCEKGGHSHPGRVGRDLAPRPSARRGHRRQHPGPGGTPPGTYRQAPRTGLEDDHRPDDKHCRQGECRGNPGRALRNGSGRSGQGPAPCHQPRFGAFLPRGHDDLRTLRGDTDCDEAGDGRPPLVYGLHRLDAGRFLRHGPYGLSFGPMDGVLSKVVGPSPFSGGVP